MAALAAVWVSVTTGVRADHFRIPEAVLVVGAQQPLSGELGTWCTADDGCRGRDGGPAQDWLTVPFGETVDPHARFTITLDDGSALGTWSAYYGPANQDAPPTHQLASGANSSSGAASFTGPPTGDWSLAFAVDTDGENAGAFTAIYFWRLNVAMPDTSTLDASRAPSHSDPEFGLPVLLFGTLAALAAAAFDRRRRAEPVAEV